jgi:regulator of replication initiation timing
MAFNRTFNSEEQARLKRLIDEGMQVTFEMETLREGLRDTVKAIAEERLHTKPASKMNMTSSMNLKLFLRQLGRPFKENRTLSTFTALS